MLTREELRQKNNAKARRHHPFRHLVSLVFFLGLTISMCGVGVFFYYISSAPTLNTSAMKNDNTVKIYDSSHHLISKLGAHQRDYIKYKDVPKQFIDGLTSIEDRHFFSGRGVDPVRIGEAEIADLKGSGGVQGGSTLTQQLVKLSVFSTKTKDRTLKRKAQEAYLALKLNRKYSKQQILEYYVNKVYMGHNLYGMETASQYYFNKPMKDLSLPQTALLAGMPQAPVTDDPYSHAQQATQRRNDVLNAMYDNHKITSSQAIEAQHTSVKQGLVSEHRENQTYQRSSLIANDYIKQTLAELKSRHIDTSAGAKVYTNLNMKNQTQMYDLANNSNKAGWSNDRMQVGSAIVNSKNGKVQAIIGGRKQSTQYGINRASQANRSNGSTNKPLMDYAPAMQYLGYQPNRLVEDIPFIYPGTSTKLYDFDHLYKGAMSMRDALVQSRNVPAIRTLQSVGVQRARKFMKGLGLETDNNTNLQNGIGGYFSPLQEASAYATFANGGIYHQPLEVNKVVSNTGQTQVLQGSSHRAMSKQVALQMNQMLEGVPKSVDGEHAKVSGLREAGKTGTTQFPMSYKYALPSYAVMDSWYAGYTPNLSMSVWTGYDQPMQKGNYLNIHEINIAQKYYKYVMQQASKGLPNSKWK